MYASAPSRDPNHRTIATLVVVVSLCAFSGTGGGYLTVLLASNSADDDFWRLLGSAWPLWSVVATQIAVLVTVGARRRRATGVATVALVLTTVAGQLHHTSSRQLTTDAEWVRTLPTLLPLLLVAAALLWLIRDPGAWRPIGDPATLSSSWGCWLLYIAMPSGALQVGIAFGVGFQWGPAQSPYLSAVQHGGVLAAALLYALTLEHRIPAHVVTVGIALVLLAQLPDIGMESYQIAERNIGLHGAGPAPMIAVALSCGLLAAIVGCLLVAGRWIARRRTRVGQRTTERSGQRDG